MDLARRQDGAAVANGEWAPLLVDATGALVVTGGAGGGGGSTDVSDRVGRLVGHVTVDNASIPVTGTFFPPTQPVSLAAAVDVSDRAARLVGHVTVDNASLAVTGTFFQATQPVSGAVSISGSVAVTGPLTDTQLRASAVPVTSTPATSATSAVTNVAASATSVTLKASNAARRALYIENAGTSTLFAKLGATATATTSYTHAIPPGGFWELPDDPIYTGIVDGIWAATGGNGALVTELT